MLDVYTPVSAQHKYLKGKMSSLLMEALLKIGYEEEDVDIRSFQGGGYTSCKEVVGNPHMLVLIVDHVGTTIGKGAYSEIVYAKSQSIPVFAVSSKPQKIHLVQDTANHDEDNWRKYCQLSTKELTREKFIEILNNFGVLHESGLIELTENVERVTSSKKRLLLLS